MMKTFVLLTLCVAASLAQDLNEQERPIVETKQGKVQGSVYTNQDGKNYFGFKGIPYAKPPVGDLRFKRPEPATPWTEVRDSSKEGPVCLQFDAFFSRAKVGSEDCLFVNVYTPELFKPGKERKAVMVWIHGGGYFMGSGDTSFAGPGRLMNHDVILVTLNYRLGPFGFLSTGDDVIQGNYGLWDQNQALKWVQENIEAFGGEKTKVTIFGESAGGGSVSQQFLSKQSKGLFSGAIAQSGVATNPWALQENPRPIADSIADELKCPNDSSSKMADCLRSKDADQILTAYIKRALPETTFPLNLVPVVETQGSDRFLDDTPENIIKNKQYNQVPLIAGFMESEGLSFVDLIKNTTQLQQFDKDFLENKFEVLVNILTDFKNNQPQIAEKLKKAYFDGIDLGDFSKVRGPLTELMSTASFDAGTLQFVKFLAQSDPQKTYLYRMVYKGNYSFTNFFMNSSDPVTAPTHADDMIYLFDPFFNFNVTLEGKDKKFSKKLLTLWTNFAKNGVPTTGKEGEDWQPVTSPDDLKYLKIDQDMKMENNFRPDKMKLWNEELPMINAGKQN